MKKVLVNNLGNSERIGWILLGEPTSTLIKDDNVSEENFKLGVDLPSDVFYDANIMGISKMVEKSNEYLNYWNANIWNEAEDSNNKKIITIKLPSLIDYIDTKIFPCVKNYDDVIYNTDNYGFSLKKGFLVLVDYKDSILTTTEKENEYYYVEAEDIYNKEIDGFSLSGIYNNNGYLDTTKIISEGTPTHNFFDKFINKIILYYDVAYSSSNIVNIKYFKGFSTGKAVITVANTSN